MRTFGLILAVFLLPGPAWARPGPDWQKLEALQERGELKEALQLVESWSGSDLIAVDRLRAAAERQGLLHSLGRFSEAQRFGQVRVELAREMHDQGQLAEARYRLALSLGAQNMNLDAARQLTEALELARASRNRTLELRILEQLSFIRMSMAEYRETAQLLDAAEAVWTELGRDASSGALLWERKGTLQLSLGNHYAAATLLEQALELARKAGPRDRIRVALTNLAQAHMRLNNWLDAIELLTEAIEQGQSRDPVALATLGICYFELNQFDRARRTFEEVRELGRDQGRLSLEAWATAELGIVAREADQDFEQALTLYNRGIEMFHRARSFNNEAAFIENRGHLYRDMGRYPEALEQYDQAEGIRRRLGLGPGPALLKGRGQCLAATGRREEAVRRFDEALDAARRAGDDKRVWQTHWEKAKFFREEEEYEEADRAFELSIEQIEASRRDLRLPGLKTDFFQDKVRVYEQYVDLLAVQMGAVDRAFQIAERARARSFLDALAEVRADLHGTLPEELVRKEATILEKISLLQAEVRRAGANPELNRELQAQEAALEGLYLDLRSRYPLFHTFRYPEPADLPAVQARLEPAELLANYFVGEDRSHLWVVSREHVEHRLLPGRRELETLVLRVYRSLLDSRQPASGASQLSRVLLPDGAGWEGEQQVLSIVPSGLLYYFPFEVLNVGERGLATRFQTAYLPSASALTTLRRPTGPRAGPPRLLAVGDADYTRVASAQRSASLRSLQDLGSLPHTRAEVNRIRSVFGRLHSTLLLGEEATESRFKALPLSDFSVIHLAAHGWLDPLLPSRSGIVLGLDASDEEDGVLQAREVFRLPLKAELVTLSACQTALGKLVTGEGMVGLTQAFFFAGTRSVVASLWNVNDEATARFMSLFYQHLSEGLSKAGALQRARTELQADPRYRHPYYWAPYVLIGEGQGTVEFPAEGWGLGWVLGLLLVGAGLYLRKKRFRHNDGAPGSAE